MRQDNGRSRRDTAGPELPGMRIPVEQPGERGAVLTAVLLILMMLSALSAALMVNVRTEALIAYNERAGSQAAAAAEAGLNHATELATTFIAEWSASGFLSAEAAIDALLLGPDGLSGTVATDADNGSLGTRTGITAAEQIALGAQLSVAAGYDASYEAFVMDDDATAPDEPGNNLVDDQNERVIIRSTGYGPDDTTVTLEAIIGPIPLPAMVVDGDLTVSGNATIAGSNGGLHANGDLDIDGNAVTLTGTATASGIYTGSPAGTGSAPELPVHPIHASDYLGFADYILTSAGTMTDPAGTVVCAATPCHNWHFSSGEWSIHNAEPPTGTYYVEGAVAITGNPGTAVTPVHISIIAEQSIDISGNADVTPDTPDLMFVTDGDLDFTGGTEIHAPGKILVREQVRIAGNPEILGQVLVEDATSVDPLVSDNTVSGNVDITYNGDIPSDTFGVTGWRDVR